MPIIVNSCVHRTHTHSHTHANCTQREIANVNTQCSPLLMHPLAGKGWMMCRAPLRQWPSELCGRYADPVQLMRLDEHAPASIVRYYGVVWTFSKPYALRTHDADANGQSDKYNTPCVFVCVHLHRRVPACCSTVMRIKCQRVRAMERHCSCVIAATLSVRAPIAAY